ncbi:MAG TPA: RimK family alpha-L-glutamate ligase [Polyangia bacterium]|nr:RimK family alpha-L-glutamate ligase [Polyangia bacterium]
MRLGIISAYPEEDWHARRILEAARERAEAELLSPLDFAADVGPAHSRLLVGGRPHVEYDALLTPRALGDEGDHELQLELYRTLAEEGALLVNDVRALVTAIDKFKTSWLLGRMGLPTPRAIVVQRPEDARRALAGLGGRAVAKPLYGSLGIGVELVTSEAAALECLGRWKALYLQEYVDGGGVDLRAFVVGHEVAAAIRRVAPPGEFRTNIHLGGVAEGVQLRPEVARLAVAATRCLCLDYAGVDLMETPTGAVVLEVNGTPLFRGIYEATGRDMAIPIVEYALVRAANSPPRGRLNGTSSWPQSQHVIGPALGTSGPVGRITRREHKGARRPQGETPPSSPRGLQGKEQSHDA